MKDEMTVFPPNLEAERSVLAAAMTSQEVARELLELLAGTDDIRDTPHRIIAESVFALAAQYVDTDAVSVKEHLRGRRKLNQCSPALLKIQGSFITVSSARAHAGVLAVLAERQRLLDSVEAAMARLKVDDPVDAILEQLSDTIDKALHPDHEKGKGRIRLTPASDIKPRPVVWAWEDEGKGRIPAGSLVIAAGREGTGKSSFGIWMASEVTRGTLPGSLYGHPRSVVYVAVEDSWAFTLVPRLIAADADLDRVYRAEVVISQDETGTLSLPRDLVELEKLIIQHDVGMVVLDPLMSTIGESIDTHREREVRKALDPLSKLADQTGAVVLGIAHFNKGGGTDASSLITGSGAFKNVPRAILGFARDPEDGTRVMTQTKNSLGMTDLPSLAYLIESKKVPTDEGEAEVGRFAFNGESTRSVEDVLSDRSDPDERSERDEAAAWLAEYITAQGETPANDACKAGMAAGFSRDTLKRAKSRAGVESRKGSFGSGWVWAMADPQGSTKGAKGA